jgi:hypothetical protein
MRRGMCMSGLGIIIITTTGPQLYCPVITAARIHAIPICHHQLFIPESQTLKLLVGNEQPTRQTQHDVEQFFGACIERSDVCEYQWFGSLVSDVRVRTCTHSHNRRFAHECIPAMRVTCTGTSFGATSCHFVGAVGDPPLSACCCTASRYTSAQKLQNTHMVLVRQSARRLPPWTSTGWMFMSVYAQAIQTHIAPHICLYISALGAQPCARVHSACAHSGMRTEYVRKMWWLGPFSSPESQSTDTSTQVGRRACPDVGRRHNTAADMSISACTPAAYVPPIIYLIQISRVHTRITHRMVLCWCCGVFGFVYGPPSTSAGVDRDTHAPVHGIEHGC